MRATWTLIDVRGDGKVTGQELKRNLSNIGKKLLMSEVKEMVRTADPHGLGFISFMGFCESYSHPSWSPCQHLAELCYEMEVTWKSFEKEKEGGVRIASIMERFEEMGHRLSLPEVIKTITLTLTLILTRTITLTQTQTLIALSPFWRQSTSFLLQVKIVTS